jgi:hypothetical protein
MDIMAHLIHHLTIVIFNILISIIDLKIIIISNKFKMKIKFHKLLVSPIIISKDNQIILKPNQILIKIPTNNFLMKKNKKY